MISSTSPQNDISMDGGKLNLFDDLFRFTCHYWEQSPSGENFNQISNNDQSVWKWFQKNMEPTYSNSIVVGGGVQINQLHSLLLLLVEVIVVRQMMLFLMISLPFACCCKLLMGLQGFNQPSPSLSYQIWRKSEIFSSSDYF